MPNYNVNIRVSAEDRASGPLQGIGRSVGGLGRTAQRGFSGLQKTVGVGLVGAVGAAGAALGGLAFEMRDSIGLAKEQQDAEKQLAQVIKSTGSAAGLTAAEVKEMASELQGVTNFGDEATLQGQNMLLTFTNIGKDVFPAATETMLDMSQALGQDLSSSAKQLGQALNDPAEGLTRLTRSGVSFTEQQEEQIKAMQEAGDLAGAQEMILAELERQFGGSARALADPAIQAQNAWGDFKEVVGGVGLELRDRLAEAALPMIQTGIEKANEFIDMFKTNLEILKNPLDALIASLDVFLPTEVVMRIQDFVQNVRDIIDRVKETLQPVFEFISNHIELRDVLIALSLVILSIVIPALGGIMAAIGPVILIAGGLVVAVAGLRKAWENDFLGMRTATQNFWKNTMSPFVDDMRDQIGEKGPKAVSALQNVWEDKLQPAVEGFVDFAREHLFPLFQAFADVYIAAHILLIKSIVAVWKNVLIPALKAAWRFIRDHILPIFGSMNEAIGGIGGAIDTVSEKLSGFAEGLNNVGNNLPGWLTPGSPTPFEMGLRGISGAMDEVRRSQNTFSSSLVINAPLVGGVTMTGEADEQRLANTMMERLESMWSASGQAGSRWPVGTTEVA